MKIRLSVAENLYLMVMTVLLAAVLVLGSRLMRSIAHFQAQKLREVERDALIRDVESWLEVQRGRA